MQDTQKNFYKKLLGTNGEKRAIKYLKKQGYKILDNNYKTRLGEIDIIAEKESTLVFVEVKTRTSEEYGSPCEAVTKIKQRHIINVATEYLVANALEECECRFDVIEILDKKINHIINAFSA